LVGLAAMPEVAGDLALLLGLGEHRLEIDHGRVAALGEIPVEIEDVGYSARHAGRKVSPGDAEHRHRSARHVLAAVITDALDDGGRARVAHREALARDAAEVGLARDRAVEDDVARDDVLSRLTAELG